MPLTAKRIPRKTPSERHAKDLGLLFEISRGFAKSTDLREVLYPVLDKLVRSLGLRRSAVSLVDPNDEDATIELCSGLTALKQRRGTWRFGEGITGEVIRTGRPMVIPRISRDRRFLNLTGARVAPPGQDLAFICVPIRVGTDSIGTLSADRTTADRLTLEHDLRLFTIVATMIADAVYTRRCTRLEALQLETDNARLQRQLQQRYRSGEIVGRSKVMRQVIAQLNQVAPNRTGVLLLGESGSGKDLLAHAIHFGSPRATMPFLRVDCAMQPDSTLERELFGVEGSASTGTAVHQKGRLESADGGSILLDNITALSERMQRKVLRVLEERQFERVGGTDVVRVDVRVIATSDVDLEEQISEGNFRRDLHGRLNAFSIKIPPLRKRRTDILHLVNHFIAQYGEQNGGEVKRISTPAIDMLLAYHWPGNVGELESCIEQAVRQSTDGVIHGHHLPPTLQTGSSSDTEQSGSLKARLANVEREIIVESLKTSRGNMAKAARDLEVTERIMGLRVRRYDIDPKRFKMKRVRRRTARKEVEECGVTEPNPS